MFSFSFAIAPCWDLKVVRTVLSLNSEEWFWHNGTEWKIHSRYRDNLKFESCTTSFGRSSDNCTKERAPPAARLFFPHSNNDITHLLHCCCLNSLLVGVLDIKCGLSLIIFSPLWEVFAVSTSVFSSSKAKIWFYLFILLRLQKSNSKKYNGRNSWKSLWIKRQNETSRRSLFTWEIHGYYWLRCFFVTRYSWDTYVSWIHEILELKGNGQKCCRLLNLGQN